MDSIERNADKWNHKIEKMVKYLSLAQLSEIRAGRRFCLRRMREAGYAAPQVAHQRELVKVADAAFARARVRP